MAQESPEFNVGDYVYVGDSRDLTWEIVGISPSATAFGPLYILESGQSSRHRYEIADHLTLYRRAE